MSTQEQKGSIGRQLTKELSCKRPFQGYQLSLCQSTLQSEFLKCYRTEEAGDRTSSSTHRFSKIGNPSGLWAKVGRLFNSKKREKPSRDLQSNAELASESKSPSLASQERDDSISDRAESLSGGDDDTTSQGSLEGEDSPANFPKSRAGAMSTYFISHGGPSLPLEDIPARTFLQELPNIIRGRPKAILAVSAHWDTHEPAVNVVNRNSTIYDFYGFPPELYQMKYTPPGAPDLAGRVKELLQEAGFKSIGEDKNRGLDHGAWVPLKLMYPDADIPVCQLSVQSRKDAAHHYRVGQALAPLVDDGVLILGTGTAVHNLRTLQFDSSRVPAWAKAFVDWLTDSLINNRYEDVIQWMEKAPYARKAHPSSEHFVPLLVALGAAGEGARAELIHSSWVLGTSSMASFAFHPASSATNS